MWIWCHLLMFNIRGIYLLFLFCGILFILKPFVVLVTYSSLTKKFRLNFRPTDIIPFVYSVRRTLFWKLYKSCDSLHEEMLVYKSLPDFTSLQRWESRWWRKGFRWYRFSTLGISKTFSPLFWADPTLTLWHDIFLQTEYGRESVLPEKGATCRS